MTDTATLTAPAVRPRWTDAERAEHADLVVRIAAAAAIRRAIHTAYALPHRSDGHTAALAALRTKLGLTCQDPERHRVPDRRHGRPTLTALHDRLAELRGKRHRRTSR